MDVQDTFYNKDEYVETVGISNLLYAVKFTQTCC